MGRGLTSGLERDLSFLLPNNVMCGVSLTPQPLLVFQLSVFIFIFPCKNLVLQEALIMCRTTHYFCVYTSFIDLSLMHIVCRGYHWWLLSFNCELSVSMLSLLMPVQHCYGC